MPYDTSAFADSIRRDCYLPTAQHDFTDAVLLNIADEEFLRSMATALVALHDNYYFEPVFITYVPGQNEYPLPEYAMWINPERIDIIIGGIANSLRRLGNMELGSQQADLPGQPNSYYLKHDTVVFFPTPVSPDQFRVFIYRRPGRMVPITIQDPQTKVISGYNAGFITNVNYATGDVTYANMPAVGFTANSFHDFYSSRPPFRRLQTKIQALNLAGTVQTFPISSVQELNVGDYVCRLDETVYPPCQLELQPFLRDLVLRRLSRTQMDSAAYALQKEEILNSMRAFMDGPASRMKGQPKSLNLFQNGLLAVNASMRFP